MGLDVSFESSKSIMLLGAGRVPVPSKGNNCGLFSGSECVVIVLCGLCLMHAEVKYTEERGKELKSVCDGSYDSTSLGQ